MKKILIIIPYDHIYPPWNGGMQRCFNILLQLSKHFSVTAIIKQSQASIEAASATFPDFTKIKIHSYKDSPKRKDIFSFFPPRIAQALKYRIYNRILRGTTDSNFVLYYPVLKKVLQKERFDAVILENLDTVKAARIIRRYDCKVPVLYDAHNVESDLIFEYLKTKRLKENFINPIIKVESTLFKILDALLTCSEKDRHTFIALNQNRLPVFVIPNGVNIPKRFQSDEVNNESASHILFCGSLEYQPNEEAIIWFYNAIWPSVKKAHHGIKLLLVGSGTVPDTINKIIADQDIIGIGQVDELAPVYNMSAIAIVPIRSGSGTRLKILEAMAHGVPVVSTSKGAEGIEYEEGQELVIADDPQLFASELLSLLRNKNKRIDIQNKALKLVVDKYDWDKVGLRLRDCIYEISNLPVKILIDQN